MISLRSHVTCCRWMDDAKKWVLNIATPQGCRKVNADFVVTASGPLHVPAYPDGIGVSVTGRCNFKGRAFHTAKWDSKIDLKGKRVAIIGTGASAIQIIPIIAESVSKLYVFQRTPPWVIYKPDFHYPEMLKFLFRVFPILMNFLRIIVYICTELRFPTLIVGSLFHLWLKWDLNQYMKSQIPDEKLRKRLTPSYSPGCKRLLFHNSYYKTFLRENVELITAKISQISETVRYCECFSFNLVIVLYLFSGSGSLSRWIEFTEKY
jgi:cation diffusion facilitator CzcD-associated flavoprotein CzcO